MARKDLNFSCLEKFVGHKVYIHNKEADIYCCYNNLQVDYDADTYNDLILIDEDNGCKTWIPLDSIELVNNISDDLYIDRVDIKTAQYNWKIGCAEERPVYPRCHKCGKEIKEIDATIWRINGNANYGSHYDNPDENRVVNGLCFCDDCVYGFVGSIEDLVDDNWLVNY